MSKTYTYNNRVWTEEDVLKAAQRKNLSIDEYVEQYGINVVEDEYSLSKPVDDPETEDVDESISYNDFLNKTFSKEELLSLAKEKNLTVDEYVEQYGINQKKRHDERQLVSYETWLNEFAPHKLSPSQDSKIIQDSFSFLGGLIGMAVDMTPFGDFQNIKDPDVNVKARKRKLREDRQKAYEIWLNEFNPDYQPSNIAPEFYYMVDDLYDPQIEGSEMFTEVEYRGAEKRVKYKMGQKYTLEQINADPSVYLGDDNRVYFVPKEKTVGGVSEEDLKTVFGKDLSSDEFYNFIRWYNTSDEAKNLKAQFKATRKVNLTTQPFDKKLKADIVQNYLYYKQTKFENEYEIYRKNGIPNLIAELNSFDNDTKELVQEFDVKAAELESMLKKFNDGSLEQNKENVNNFNNLRLEVLTLENNYKNLLERANVQLSSRQRRLLDGYFELADNAIETKAMLTRFYKDTTIGQLRKELMDNQAANDEHYEKYGEIGIQESLENIWNTITEYVRGGAVAMNTGVMNFAAGVDPDDAEYYKTRAMLFNETTETVFKKYAQFTTSTQPFTDPETGDWNLNKLLPNLTKTVTDMYLMSKGGRMAYTTFNKVGKLTKGGILKSGAKPKSLKELSSFYKSSTSLVGASIGSIPVLLPQNMSEAFSQIDENFTVNDAMDYSLQTTFVEASIEMINPDFKYLKPSIAKLKKTIKDPKKLLQALKNEKIKALGQAFKSVGPELVEEYLQLFSKGAIDMSYNNQYGTDFQLPESSEIKETALLTVLSVLAMRTLSGNITKADQTDIYRVASQNYDGFLNELDRQLENKEITEDQAEKIKTDLENYILISGDVESLIFDEDGNSKITEERADELIKLITERNALQVKIDEGGPLAEDYQKQLEQVETDINNMQNTIEQDSSLRKVAKTQGKIYKIKQKLKDKEIGDEKKKELKKELAKLEKQLEIDAAFTPEYSIDGKTYKTKKEFLDRIKAHKFNGDFKRGRQLNIKVKNDFNVEKEAYAIMGKYAPKQSQERVVMSNAQAIRTVKFINNRSQFDIEEALREEQSKENPDVKKVQQLQDALKYFELKRANYKFGEKGYLMPKTVGKSKVTDIRLKRSIDFVVKYGEEIGGKTKVISSEKKFNALMDKLGIKGAKGTDGFYDPNTKTFYINEDVARKKKAVNVGSHELLHGIMWSTLNGPLRTVKDPSGNDVEVNITEDGLKLVKQFIDIIKKNSQFKIVQERIDKNYRYNKDGSEKALEEYAEEYINVFVDALRPAKGQPAIKFEESIFRKLINLFKRFFKGKGFVNLEFKDGRALYDFLKAYDADRVAGTLRKSIVEFGKKSMKAQKEGKIQPSKTASDNVQNLYENRNENPGFEFDIIQEFKPITSRIADKRRDAPGFDKELLMSEIEIGERGILDLIKEYNPDSGVPLAAYINKFLPARAIEASRRVLGEQFTEDVTAAKDISVEPETEVSGARTKPEKKEILLSERLNITKRVADAVERIVSDLDLANVNFKNLKNQIPEITGDLFGIAPKKVTSLANLTKKELQSAQMFINKNADLLIAMLPEGATTGGTATGVPNTLLKAFYTKTERAKAAKTGSTAGLAIQEKRSISKAEFLETFGIVDGKPVRSDRNTSARVLALANLTGKMITNQAVRQQLEKTDKSVGDITRRIKDGKSKLLFSKNEEADNFKETYQIKLPQIFELIKYNRPETITKTRRSKKTGKIKSYTTRDLNAPLIINGERTGETILEGATRIVNEFVKEYPQYRDLLRSTLTGGYDAGLFLYAERKPNTPADAPVFDELIESVDAEQVAGRKKYTGDKVVTAGFNQEYLEDYDALTENKKLDVLLNIFKAIETHLSNKPADAWFFVELIADTSKSQNTFTRILAPFKFYPVDKDGNIIIDEKVTEEHTDPQGLIGKSLLVAAISGKVDTVWKIIGKSYMQGPLLDSKENPHDTIVNKAGFKETMPDIYYEKVVPRILNGELNLPNGYASIVRLAYAVHPETGQRIDLGMYVLPEVNMTITEYFGVDGITDIAQQNKLIVDFLAGDITRKQIDAKQKIKPSKSVENVQKLTKAIQASRTQNPSKGITVLDFDDTLATSKSLIKYTAPDGTTGTLTPAEYASTYQDLLGQGYEFDFSQFNEVIGGKIAPLFQKALKLQSKFGPENMFVLTARPPESAPAIFAFLQANGLNIPLKNITGLANSTSEAKALWIAEKVGEGYNDFYFADDALQNVQAVDNMLNQFDVKRKVQQAKILFSKSYMDFKFNEILQDVTGIEAEKRFSAIKARKRGASKGKFRVFVPPSHEDFVGLIYNFLGKGAKGNEHRDFFEQNLIRPLNRAFREYDTARQSIATDYKNLNKQMPGVKKKLNKKTPDGDYTYQDAIRVYLWDKHGHSIPGMSKVDQTKLVELVKSDGDLQVYADTINQISRQDTYVSPTEGWDSGDIRMDLDDATGRIGREQFFAEFIENADAIFSEQNLNKIEAAYGKGLRNAIEDMLYRIKTGRNKPSGQNEQVNKLMNYLNGSVGSVMFFNMRSALLQQMSIVNYINFSDNNIFAAAKAFANQKQYWQDWAFIFNSDMLKQRRGGVMTDINGAELAAEMRKSKNPHRFLISKLLKLGFAPTQIADNIAIATGGATFYRNRINTYLKEGLSQKEAEAKAFTDFQDMTQSTQQSARPDMVSKQQASVIGKVILNFQNVTSQYNRLAKKAFLDIKNRRITQPNKTQLQSDISNAARITYYLAVQNLIFYTLQTAMFAMMFDDDEEDVNNLFLKKQERLINGSIDSVLRGSGIAGAVISTLKNVAIAFARQRDVDYNPDESAVIVEAFNFSPVLGIKARKIVNAEKTLNYNKKIIPEMETFDLDNPQWSAYTNYVEGFTNLPLNRLYNKTMNVRQSLNNEHAAWERALMFLGWSQYNLNLENTKIENIKKEVKERNQQKKKGPRNINQRNTQRRTTKRNI